MERRAGNKCARAHQATNMLLYYYKTKNMLNKLRCDEFIHIFFHVETRKKNGYISKKLMIWL